MDLNNIGSFINTCGFPIFICIISIIAFYKIAQTLYKMWQEDVKPCLDGVKDSNIEFIKSLQSIDGRLTNVEQDVKEIKNKINI